MCKCEAPWRPSLQCPVTSSHSQSSRLSHDDTAVGKKNSQPSRPVAAADAAAAADDNDAGNGRGGQTVPSSSDVQSSGQSSLTAVNNTPETVKLRASDSPAATQQSSPQHQPASTSSPSGHASDDRRSRESRDSNVNRS